MRKLILLTVVFAVLFPFAAAQGQVNWVNDFRQFTFSVNPNGGTFSHLPSMYIVTDSDVDTASYNPTQGNFDPYNSVALGELHQFAGSIPGDIYLNGMARGPDLDASNDPIILSDGIKVQGYAEIVPENLDDANGIDISQGVTAFVSRWFNVSTDGTYVIGGELTGVPEFDEYNNGTFDKASYSVTATVSLEEMVVNQAGQVVTIELVDSWSVDFGVPFSQEVTLTSQNTSGVDITYQLKVVLEIDTDVVNIDPNTLMPPRIFTGTYEVGSDAAPIMLRAWAREPIPDPGDLDNSGDVEIQDAILSLKVVSGIDATTMIFLTADVNNDNKIGLEEAIYILQTLAVLRP